MTMPEINLAALDAKTAEIARLIVATKGKNKGRLRASKPLVKKGCIISGEAAYVWRMVAFTASPISQHHCMPVTADFDLQTTGMTYDQKRAYAKQLDRLANEILATIPREKHYGTLRWARAFGRI